LSRRRPSSLLARHLPAVPTKISVDNKASRMFTVVDVRAQDRVGLLYAIASSLTEAGLEISLAKVATEGHRAIDSFYVTCGGRPLADSAQIQEIVHQLTSAIEAFTARESPAS